MRISFVEINAIKSRYALKLTITNWVVEQVTYIITEIITVYWLIQMCTYSTISQKIIINKAKTKIIRIKNWKAAWKIIRRC